MKIGVTGASGQLGHIVVQQLLAKCPATDLVAIVRDSAKAADLASTGVEIRVATYDDRASLDAALAGLDRLLLISSNEVGRRVPQHTNVIDAAKAAGVKHFVYTSAPKATTSALVLAPEHKATEEYLASSGLTYTILRNNWYTENYAQTINKARETGAVVAAAGAGRVASATRADYAEGAAAVLVGEGHEGKVYELGGDRAWDFHELAAAIAEVTGTPCSYQAVKQADVVAAMTRAGMDEGTAGFFAAVDGNIAEGALSETSGDLAKLIGRPTTPLKESVKKLVG
ncbi:MAG: NAD(P)-dependent oxidoreductase [Actinobacteria bacterium RBG_16_64_13]|nr:MAG: NAD(P)-dependent oxidoreductase [Actinobacteria bacterium RBG_16_64_13]